MWLKTKTKKPCRCDCCKSIITDDFCYEDGEIYNDSILMELFFRVKKVSCIRCYEETRLVNSLLAKDRKHKSAFAYIK
jgi:hypothetical protein